MNYKDHFDTVNDVYNTDNFYNSLLLTFRAASGESWPLIMKEYSSVDTEILPAAVSIIYFIVLIFFCTVIMLNLFVLVVLQQYDNFHNKGDNPLERFRELTDNIRKTWNKLSLDKDRGVRINMLDVSDFILNLEGDLICDLEEKDKIYDEKTLIARAKKAAMEFKFIL